MNMNCRTKAELVDIHFNYDPANGNGRAAVRWHGERYPMRQRPTFARVHQNLAEHGSFRATIDDTPVKSKMDLVA
ncbi:hypothetical protein TNCV_4256871 [Trichonephila clavipes]|nr:hypothetical protein TNCV_4256871 [Trichonephila clavipes]